jgi:AraC-like DNA-binding protein
MDRQDDLPTLNSIGWEKRLGKEHYYWDCSNRPDKQCLFQYTVKGEGALTIGEQWYSIAPGQAFLIEIPGPFTYHFPETSHVWEYKYLSFSLNAYPLWSPITEGAGRIIDLSDKQDLMDSWDALHEQALLDGVRDIYDNSSLAYRFLMDLRRAVGQNSPDIPTPKSVKKCINFIEKEFSKPICLDDMASVVGISKFQLTRLFSASLGKTPINYLIQKRIKHAARLLIETDSPIYEISDQCGFSNPNYFTKVFQKKVTMTPSEFRKSVGNQKISEIFIK